MALDVAGLVSDIVETHDTDENRRRALLSAARANSELRDKLLWEGAGQLLRSHFTAGRRLTETPALPPNYQRKPVRVGAAGGTASKYDPSTEATVQRRNVAAKEFWNTYTLFGHQRLSTATMADLRTSAQEHEKQAGGHERAAGFERDLLNAMVLAKVKTDTRVADFFTLDKVVTVFKANEAKGARHVA